MSRYAPGPLPSGPLTPELVMEHMYKELQEIARISEFAEDVISPYLHVEPSKTVDGMLVLADGVDWNPGFGEGVYRRNKANSAWVFLGTLAASETVAGILEIATNAEALAATATDKALVPSNLAGLNGLYTPTLTGVTNVDATGAYQAQYLRVGNLVLVSGRLDVNPTALATTEVGISLPIASNFATIEQCSGTAAPTAGGIQETGAIVGDVANDRAACFFLAGSTGNHGLTYHFMYRVI